jgi:carbon storage regulator
MIGDDIEVTVLSNDGTKVRLGIQAPQAIPVHRTEVFDRIQASIKRAPAASSTACRVRMGAERDRDELE